MRKQRLQPGRNAAWLISNPDMTRPMMPRTKASTINMVKNWTRRARVSFIGHSPHYFGIVKRIRIITEAARIKIGYSTGAAHFLPVRRTWTVNARSYSLREDPTSRHHSFFLSASRQRINRVFRQGRLVDGAFVRPQDGADQVGVAVAGDHENG